jgi:hypothetical protein
MQWPDASLRMDGVRRLRRWSSSRSGSVGGAVIGICSVVHLFQELLVRSVSLGEFTSMMIANGLDCQLVHGGYYS